MNDIQISKFLGWFSLGMGTFQLLASRRIARTLGVASPRLVQAFGVREFANGIMVLNTPDAAAPVWGRVAGDAMDAAVLAKGLGYGNRQQSNATAALLLVLGTAALDLAVATALQRRANRALHTAQRTRVRQGGTQPNARTAPAGRIASTAPAT